MIPNSAITISITTLEASRLYAWLVRNPRCTRVQILHLGCGVSLLTWMGGSQ